MMLTILGLPPSTTYKDLKVLIKNRCNLADFILDELVNDNGLKKVRIGLADNNEGGHLIKCLDGYRLNGCPLSVIPVGKSQVPPQNYDQGGSFNQPQNYQQNFNNRPQWEPNMPASQLTSPQWAPNPMNQGQGPNSFGFQGSQNNQYMPPQQHQNQYPNQNQGFGQHGQNMGPPNQHNQHGMGQMRPEIKPFGRDQFNRPEQGYGGPRNNVPEPAPSGRSHALRSVEIVDTPMNRPAQNYPPQNKPMTTMKDNFQGSGPYSPTQGGGPPQASQPWIQQQQKPAPFTKPAGYEKPFDRPGKPLEPDRDYKPYDKDYGRPKSPLRKPSPRRSPGRRHSPGRMSPRRHSPGRHVSPGRRSPGRRMSPARRASPGRRASPARRVSPARGSPGRRPSPGRREPLRDDRRSPGRIAPAMEASRLTWTARRISPDTHKRDPDPSARYSPTRRALDKHEDFRDHGKAIRPAYEPTVQAPNQAMYSGGYRPNVEKDPYPKPGPRPVEPPSPWQNRDKPIRPDMLKRDDERIPPRTAFDRPGIRDKDRKRSHSPRKSRSPVRKSPSRDRFKRHSPSPRSPRRSWALEKRRSPDDREAPPPPLWPGQAPAEEKRPEFTPEDAKRRHVWEYDKKSLDVRRPDEERRFPPQDAIRVRTDLAPRPERREELEFKRDDRFGRDGPKFSPREDFDKILPKFSPRHDFVKKTRFSPLEDFDKIPKFSPRNEFDDKRSKFLPFDDKTPKFAPREGFVKPPVFSAREDYEEPKFDRGDIRKDPKYSRDFERPKFSPRDDFSDRRDDFRRHEDERKPWEVPPKPTERDDYRRDPVKVPETARMELHREVLRKMSEELDKDFEDVHKRAKDFQRRVEETRKDDRRRDYDCGEPEPRPYEDRSKSRDDDRYRFEPRRKEDWNTQEHLKIKAIKAKKDKAVEEITQKILDKHNIDAEAEQNKRVCQELSLSVNRIINDMFGDSDVSFIELIIKFNAKYSGAGEDKILRDVMASFPSQFRPKRTAPDYSDVPAKSAKRFSEPVANQGDSHTKPSNTPHVPEWDMTRAPPAAPSTVAPNPVVPNPVAYPYPPPMVQQMMVGPMNPMMMPGSMFPPSYPEGPPFQEGPQFQDPTAQADDNSNLYLCKDDFEPFKEREAVLLKTYLIQQIVKESESGRGWAPDFTFKGLHSSLRYELHTRDEQSRQWLLNHNFSGSSFKYNILVYTSEELWYERAAIWLPGHSRCRNIEPLEKLKLQNRHLDGAKVGKWKFVKKIVNLKGTRVYVDMPPSAARALEKYKMSLSYELQIVSVFLKAVAIDKDAFDLGLKDYTITDEAEIKTAINNNPMPMLAPDPKIVKIALPGSQTMTILQARKIREMLIFQIFKYHKEDGASKTDFIKHGFISPRYFGILPANPESQRWLMKLDIKTGWKLKRHPLVVVGADENTTRYISMYMYLPECENRVNAPMVIEKLKQSNRGVRGIDFTKWKLQKLTKEFHNKVVIARCEIDIDVESVEAIMKMDYKLDFVDDKNPTQVVEVKYGKTEKHLLDLIKKLKSELHDTYDNTDMDLGSDSENSSDDESVICLDND